MQTKNLPNPGKRDGLGNQVALHSEHTCINSGSWSSRREIALNDSKVLVCL